MSRKSVEWTTAISVKNEIVESTLKISFFLLRELKDDKIFWVYSVRSSVELTKASLVIFGLSVGAQMTEKADTCTQVRWQIGQGISYGYSAASVLSPGPVGLVCLGALVNPSASLDPVHDGLFPAQVSGLMPNTLTDVFKVSLKRFFWPQWDRFSYSSSQWQNSLGSRLSDMRII